VNGVLVIVNDGLAPPLKRPEKNVSTFAPTLSSKVELSEPTALPPDERVIVYVVG
jgi:hypothetical protein